MEQSLLHTCNGLKLA